MSKYVLGRMGYHSSSNNYETSSIRKILNGEFLSNYFTDTSLLLTTEVDNSSESTLEENNPYICGATYDKVFLPSKADLSNPDYGFSNNNSRKCRATEYARTVGVEDGTSGNDLHTTNYWTRSPSTGNSNQVSKVMVGGAFKVEEVNFAVGVGYRPCITLDLIK